MNLQEMLQNMGRAARQASMHMAKASTAAKNAALVQLAKSIRLQQAAILKANQSDVQQATEKGLEPALLDRLSLNEKSVEAMAQGLEQMAQLPDPVGEMTEFKNRPSGILVGKMRVPLGVVGIIYESRPNVTIDAAGLCIKSGNAAILRGGSEALQCNLVLANLIQQALQTAGLPSQACQVLDTPDREAVKYLITLNHYIDVLVPRGGKGLIERISREATVPVIKHLDGICHVYVCEHAHLPHAIRIADNAKTHRYGTCNTMETLLVHERIAAELFAALLPIYQQKGVELRGCPTAVRMANQLNIPMNPALDADWATEYLAPILSIRVVQSLDDAMAHINQYGSHHTDSIVTEQHSNAMRFIREVDSASVMINASTRFADGFEYGLGAEIGISTDKIHARGPVGLEGLTSQKWVVFGQGEIRS